MKDIKQKLWDLSVQAANLSVEINDSKKRVTAILGQCPCLEWKDGFLRGETHFHAWFAEAKELNCQVEDLEDFGDCHYCLDAYQKIKKRKKLQLQRGHLRSQITKLVRGAV